MLPSRRKRGGSYKKVSVVLAKAATFSTGLGLLKQFCHFFHAFPARILDDGMDAATAISRVAGKNMHMQVRDYLSPYLVVVPPHIEALRPKGFLKKLHDLDHGSHQFLIFSFREVKHGFGMLFWDNYSMALGVGVSIKKSQVRSIFVDFVRGNFPFHNLAEDAISHDYFLKVKGLYKFC